MTPKLSNSPRNEPESAKTVTVVDRHVSAPWGSITMEIALGSQNGEYSPRNGPELAKTMSVDDGHVNASPGIVNHENRLGPENGE